MLARAGDYPLASGPYDATIGARRVAWHDRRTQITTTHAKRSRLTGEPEDVQARHSPTVEIAIDDSDGKKRARRNMTRVKQSEAWRHNQLSGVQRQAESEMYSIYRERTVGLRSSSGSLGLGISGGRNADADAADRSDRESAWLTWFAQARKKKVATSVVIACIDATATLRELDSSYGKRHGWALRHYRSGLDLWAILRGWLPRSYILGA